MKKKLKSL